MHILCPIWQCYCRVSDLVSVVIESRLDWRCDCSRHDRLERELNNWNKTMQRIFIRPNPIWHWWRERGSSDSLLQPSNQTICYPVWSTLSVGSSYLINIFIATFRCHWPLVRKFFKSKCITENQFQVFQLRWTTLLDDDLAGKWPISKQYDDRCLLIFSILLILYSYSIARAVEKAFRLNRSGIFFLLFLIYSKTIGWIQELC